MITLTAEQAQQIEKIIEHLLTDHPTARHHRACIEALSIIRAARAQEQAEQEPVAWALSHSQGIIFSSKYPMRESKEIVEQMAREHMGAVVVTPLYAAPVRTKDLTPDDIDGLILECALMGKYKLIQAVIAADRELNK